jgi:uncharacterized protein YdaU (DUF1376 family)
MDGNSDTFSENTNDRFGHRKQAGVQHMSRVAHIRIYPSDWRSGCLGLSLEQEGLYIRMCMFIAEANRRVPIDDTEAARMLNVQTRNYRRVLGELLRLGKVQRHENGYGNDRVEHERNEAEKALDRKSPSSTGGGSEGQADQGQIREDRRSNGSTSAVERTYNGDITPLAAEIPQQKQCTSIEPESEPEKKEDKTPLPPDGGLASPNTHLEALRAFEAYNARALVLGLPQASKLTPDRKRRISARLRDFGPDGWSTALANLDTPFLRGLTEHRFRADLDFVCQPKSFSKLHDGGYAPAQAQGSTHAIGSNRPARYPTKHDRLQAVVAGCLQRNAGADARPTWARDLDGDALPVIPGAQALWP